MRNPMQPHPQNPYEKATKVVSGILAGVFTFFVFPFAFLSVDGITAFSSDKYSWLPVILVELVWGLILLAGLFALSMLVFHVGLNAAMKLLGRISG